MQTYTSGNPRVHISIPEIEIKSAIDEYERYAERHPSEDLSKELLECVVDLREELTLRHTA